MDRTDRYRLAAEIGCNEATVRRWVDGEQVAPTTAWALQAACKKLGITNPHEPTASAQAS